MTAPIYRLILALVVAAAAAAPADAASPDTPYHDCGSYNGRILSIEVSPCDETVCVFRKGQNVTVHLEFLSEVDVPSSWVALYGVTNPFFDHSFGSPEDFCQMTGITCPMHNLKTYSFTVTTYIKPWYPRMNADIKLRIYSDQLWRDIICVQVPVQIIG